MSIATISTHAGHRSVDVVGRVRRSLTERRDSARGRRQLETVLAGHHGRAMRDELRAVMSRS